MWFFFKKMDFDHRWCFDPLLGHSETISGRDVVRLGVMANKISQSESEEKHCLICNFAIIRCYELHNSLSNFEKVVSSRGRPRLRRSKSSAEAWLVLRWRKQVNKQRQGELPSCNYPRAEASRENTITHGVTRSPPCKQRLLISVALLSNFLFVPKLETLRVPHLCRLPFLTHTTQFLDIKHGLAASMPFLPLPVGRRGHWFFPATYALFVCADTLGV